MPADDVAVTWEVSDTPEFGTIVASGVGDCDGRATGTASTPSRRSTRATWFYRFRVGAVHQPGGHDPPGARRRRRGRRSDVRRRPVARTTPTATTPRIATSAEQHTRLRRLARRLHLRGSRRTGRRPAGAGTPRSRADHARGVSQPLRAGTRPIAHLQAAHVACPWFVDLGRPRGREQLRRADTAGSPPTHQRLPTRRFAAYQAWWEHQPVRLRSTRRRRQEYRIYREVQWGELIDLRPARRSPVSHRSGVRRRDVEPRSTVCRGRRSSTHDARR